MGIPNQCNKYARTENWGRINIKFEFFYIKRLRNSLKQNTNHSRLALEVVRLGIIQKPVTNIIGINWEHSTASLWVDGELKGCISEERLSRVKNDERYPKLAIEYLLKEHKINRESVDKVVFVSTMWSYEYITRHYTNFTVKDYIDEQYKVWKLDY